MTDTPLALEGSLLARAQSRFDAVRERIAAAARRAQRAPDSVTLVGVAKKQPRERVLAAIVAGVRVLGESYLQEARIVRPEIEAALAGDPATRGVSLEWRLVGRLQRNKVAHAIRLFDAIESVDRPELIDALARRAAAVGRRLDVLIQVGLCDEAQKGGCDAASLPTLADQIERAESLHLAGLMTVPPADPDPEAARPVFRRLRSLRDALAAADPTRAPLGLSMGMSRDFEVGIEEGATLVRVGTALFGQRDEV